jgi:hypothetical protein
MSDHAKILRPEILKSLAGQTPGITLAKGLEPVIEAALRAAIKDGRAHMPEAVASHGMRLGLAYSEIRDGTGQGYYVPDLVRWLAITHFQDVTSMASRMSRQTPDFDTDAALTSLLESAENLLKTGTFGQGFAPDTELARSRWNGRSHELRVENWRFHLQEVRIGPMRMGQMLYPLLPAPVPEIIQFSMRFPTGRLIISSDALLPDLADAHIKMRQDAEFGALQADLAVTQKILDDNAMFALPIPFSSLVPLHQDGQFSLLSRKDPDCDDDDFDSRVSLDYRHVLIADEEAYLEAARTSWNEPRDTIKARLDDARTRSSLSTTEVQIEPGRYSVTIPANHRSVLPDDMPCLGGRDHVVFNLERIGDR